MNAAKLLRAIPPMAWITAGGVLLLYVLGRQALARLPGGASAASIGETLGRGAGELVSGAVSGAAAGTGSVLGAVIKAPSQAADSAVRAITDGRGLSVGSWFYDLVHDDYNPNAKPPTASDDDKSFLGQLWERIS